MPLPRVLFQFVTVSPLFFAALLAGLANPLTGQDAPQRGGPALYARENLVAWCIVPFDARRRGPEERAAMLERLGFRHFAYDWRAEHLPTFEQELDALARHKVQLDAVWFSSGLDRDGRFILDALTRRGLKPQLWVTGGGEPTKTDADQRQRVVAEAARIRPIAVEAARIGCTVGLYNHGGWFGEPENQLAVIAELNLPNVGIVYNLHHGHDHLARFPELLKKMQPHLLVLNLNGMIPEGDRHGNKILPLGQGNLDLALLKTIRESDYRGPIGILGHTQDDAEARLLDNLDGLDWLLPQLVGQPARPRPKLRTPGVAAPASPTPAGGWLAEGRAEYREPPLTVECRARLKGKTGYNILVASDPKSSGAHWELFTMAGTGRFSVYLPGATPDHVHSQSEACDKTWHTLAMQFERNRVRLFADGKLAADQPVTWLDKPIAPGGLAFGRLVEGGIGCDGELAWVRLSRGVRNIAGVQENIPAVDDRTLGLWLFAAPGVPASDRSTLNNPAKVAGDVNSNAPPVPPGNHLTPADPRLKAVLVDRSQDDAYMAVKVDSAGRVFVGGREALFLFEPNAAGGYAARRELFRFPPDSVIIGIEFRGPDLYVLANNALYLFPEGRTRHEGLAPRRLVWGVPLDYHVSFHCLAWGPEGDLYLNHGDPLLNYGDWNRPDHWGHWTLFSQPEGTRTPYTGAGGVLRVHPDGTGLQVVAGGLRGPVGLAFDRQWNLFTNDNDHESRADQYAPARLLHVTPQADFAWPRGWIASKSPDRADLLEPMSAVLGRGVPCDLAYYDDPYLPGDLRGSLLLCRWDRMAVARHAYQPRGASFAADDAVFATGEHQARPVGVAVGRGGRVFVTSLYLGGNVVTPHCVSDLTMITRADDPATHPFEPYEITNIADAELWPRLSSPSADRRSQAHVELLRRGGPRLDEAARRLADAAPGDPAQMHLPWLAGASATPQAGQELQKLAHSAQAELRLVAIRVLTEFPQLASPGVFEAALTDAAPPVQLAALAHYFKSPESLPVDQVARLAASEDSYLRQTATRLLAQRARTSALTALAESHAGRARLAAVLAAGFRLTIPPADDVPPEALPLFYPAENAFFHVNQRFADMPGAIDLRDLGRVGSYTAAQRWNLARPAGESLTLFELLTRALDDAEPAVALQAAYFLGLLHDPQAEPMIARTQRRIRLASLAGAPRRDIAQCWSVGPFAAGPGDPSRTPSQGAVDLTAEFTQGGRNLNWQPLAGTAGRFGWPNPPRREGRSSYTLFLRLQSLSRQLVLLQLQTHDTVAVWHNAKPIEAAPAASGGIVNLLLDAQPGSNDVVVQVECGADSTGIGVLCQARDGVTAELPDKLDGAELAQRLKAGQAGVDIPPEMLALDWVGEVRQGNVPEGRKLFGSLGCAKCHAITPQQQGGGAPSLAEAGRRFTIVHLVESVLLPSKQIAEPFQATVVVTTQGRVVTGLVINETAGQLDLLLPDATHATIAVSDVEDRSRAKISPMPAGLVKTSAELRNLLAYLVSENPAPP